MVGLQEIDVRQIKEIISEAASRQVPAAVTLRADTGWIQLRSRMVGADDERVLIEPPVAEDGTPREFAPGARIGITFKLRHHKYVCEATVAGPHPLVLDDGSSIQVLGLCRPTRMQRIQRRAFFRADVPAGRVVRASFWLGGREAEPNGTTPDKPVLTGRVMNISAGGFQVRTADRLPEIMESGYLVGVRISFGAGAEGIFADAQIRHVASDGDGFVIGFQFIGLGQTVEGKSTLRLIASKVNEFQRLAPREAAPSGATI